jgi:hypothetical protein
MAVLDSRAPRHAPGTVTSHQKSYKKCDKKSDKPCNGAFNGQSYKQVQRVTFGVAFRRILE